jgi:hypothetical protein
MFMLPANTMQEAIGIAFGIMGTQATVNVLPEGPVVIPVAGPDNTAPRAAQEEPGDGGDK